MMDNNHPNKPKSSINFHCRSCGNRFQAVPDRIIDVDDRPWQPWAYFAECPRCYAEADQAAWEVNLWKAHQNPTGPVTPEGKSASARNLAGHPTPQEAQLTRFNAMKHGLFSRTATYFPAKPGKYPHCDGCEYLADRACLPQKACLKRTELFMRHQVAFETQDPGLLTQLRADTQAAVQALINDMILSIAQDGGPRVTSPEWYYDKDGCCHFVKYDDPDTGEKIQLMKLEAHPLLKPLIDFLSKNNMTLSDMLMTPKGQDDQDIMRGYLDGKDNNAQAEQEYREKVQDQNNQLLALIQGSYGDNDIIDVDAEVVPDSGR